MRRKESFNEALVGIFMTVVVLLLAYFTIVISGVDVLAGRSKVEMKILFDQVGGLKDHDTIMYRGTKVGIIDSVEVTPSNLIVRASVDRNVRLRTNCRVSVCNLSMLGGNYLLLEEGDGEILDIPSTLFHGETPSDWMRNVAQIAENVRAFTEMREVTSIITNMNEVSIRANQFMMRANKFAEEIQGIVTEARSFMEHAKHLAERLDHEQLVADLEAGLAGFRQAAEGLDVKGTMAKANEILDNLNVVVNQLKQGEGTLGKLLSNPEMYNEMNGLIRDMRQVLDNYRDTTPISTFSSLATGAL